MHAPRRIWISEFDRLLTERAKAEADAAVDTAPAWEHGGHAITAIILAVAAFEAHVGEWLAQPRVAAQFRRKEIDDLRWKPGYAAMVSIFKKRDSARNPEGNPWFERLKGLYELRNHVAHYTPEKRDVGTFPRRIDRYIQDGTFTPAGDHTMDWTSRLIVRSVANEAISICEEAQREFDAGVQGWL